MLSVETPNAPSKEPAAVPEVPAAVTPEVQPEVVAADTTAPVEPVVPEAPPAEAAQPAHMEILKPMLDVLSAGQQATPEVINKIAQDLGTQPEIVELLGAGFSSIMQNRIGAAYGAAGSEQSYKEIVSWAASGLPRAEAEAFNTTLSTGSIDDIKTAVGNLKTKFTAVNGSPKNETQVAFKNSGVGSSPAANVTNVALKPFASDSELSAAQRDKRYNKDSAYTQEVYARAYLMGVHKK